MICELNNNDWDQIKRIYIQGIKTLNATFEQVENVKTYKHWVDNKILDSCLGYRIENEICGWAALSTVSSRCVYSGVAETSIYVDRLHGGKGIGSALLQSLIGFAEDNGIWTLQAGIFPENKASVELHKKFEFRPVGYREKIGKLDGVWRDTLLLERRSKILI